MSESVLLEAERLVNGERAESYGDMKENWQKVTNVFNALTSRDLTVKESIFFMYAVKLVREEYQHKRDNPVDLAGYSQVLQRVQE